MLVQWRTNRQDPADRGPVFTALDTGTCTPGARIRAPQSLTGSLLVRASTNLADPQDALVPFGGEQENETL